MGKTTPINKAELFPITTRSISAARLAVIFVHGIGGHPLDTWRVHPQAPSMMELLDGDSTLCEAEFYSYGYRTGLKPWQYDFQTVAELLFTDIQLNLPDRNIVFVAHSMGGLVVQQYIINRYEAFDQAQLKAIQGVVYLSVPFHGSGLAELFPKWLVNKQIKSLRRKNPQLAKLEEGWNKYAYRGGAASLPETLKHEIQQLALRGERDRVVVKASSTPLYLSGEITPVDEDHSSICKVDKHSSVYKAIQQFLYKQLQTHAGQSNPMIIHAHGYTKQQYEEQPHIELDWTSYYDANTTPRRLPSPANWNEMDQQLKLAADYWAQNGAASYSCLKFYARLSLPGGVLIGQRFARTKGAVIEVVQGKQIWTSAKRDRSYVVTPKRSTGNSTSSKKAIVILSVSRNIESAVKSYLAETEAQYHVLLNLLPMSGSGQDSIENAEQAVSYAYAVKAAIDELKQNSIEHIDLYLDCPFGVALFVGHYLTAVSPIQVFDYMNPGYTPACTI